MADTFALEHQIGVLHRELHRQRDRVNFLERENGGMVRAIKELNRQLDEMQSEVNRLKGELKRG